ncbi:MAG: NUDIX hydrolase [Aphanothece sp. CMT-3BRIN-NPC111]|jgi:8-oxo-dGTP pyrophosphatase MutT (NUDIX family)|nr:NUDIX hydrolase [Aphanothece sp. CMT-3BRIN-NPC111]
MVRKNGPWSIQDTTQKYENSFIDVREDQVLTPDGQQGTYGTVKMKPAVGVLPIDGDRICYLIRQFRYALGRESLEVVCGAIDDQEPPLEAAQRELKEELGIEADEWSDLGILDLDTSIVQCPIHLFLAKNLTFTETQREGTETMVTVKMPFDEAIQKVMDSTITHSPSCVLLLKAQKAEN